MTEDEKLRCEMTLCDGYEIHPLFDELMTEEPPYLILTIDSERIAKDPLTLCLLLPLGLEYEPISYELSLENIINDMMDGNIDGNGNYNDEATEHCCAVSAKLRALADKIDNEVKKGSK